MHLTPREHERLLLAAAADLARRRLARGAPLGATEAVALVCDEVCELAWDGVPLPEVIDRARTVVPPAALLPGVAALVPVIEVEALFPWGSTLVHVDAPFAEHQGSDWEVPGQGQEQGAAERGRPAPGTGTARSAADGPGGPGSGGGSGGSGGSGGPSGPAGLGESDGLAESGSPGGPGRLAGPAGDARPAVPGVRYGPGAVLPRAGVIELAAGAARRAALLRNTGPRDVWISSHFPLGEVNPAVQLRWADGAEPAVPSGPTTPAASSVPAERGLRLDLPAGDALLLRAGEEREVTVVVQSG